MPVTVRFNPTVNSLQAQVIPDATPTNDGVMTKAQAAKLLGLPIFLPGGPQATRPLATDTSGTMDAPVYRYNTDSRITETSNGTHWYDANGVQTD